MHVRDEHYKILNFKHKKAWRTSKTICSLCKASTLKYFSVFDPSNKQKDSKNKTWSKRTPTGTSFCQIIFPSLTCSRLISIVNFITAQDRGNVCVFCKVIEINYPQHKIFETDIDLPINYQRGTDDSRTWLNSLRLFFAFNYHIFSVVVSFLKLCV